MKILTLCEKCRELMEEHYDVSPYIMEKATTQPEKKCENCGKPYRIQLKMYKIDRKRRWP